MSGNHNPYNKYYFTTDDPKKLIDWSAIFMKHKILWRIEQFNSIDSNELDIHVVVQCGSLDTIKIRDLAEAIGEKEVYLYFEHS